MNRLSFVLSLAVALVALAQGLKVRKAGSKQVDCSTPAECEAAAVQWLDEVYEVEYREMLETASQLDWEYNTFITDENAAEASAAWEIIAQYDKTAWADYVMQFDTDTFQDPLVKRRIDSMKVLGYSALPEDRFARFNELINRMTSIFGSARVCPFDNQSCDLATEGLSLEPDLEAILADTENHSWEELEYVWRMWRDVSGKLMREDFKEYIDISNEAAIYNNLPDAGAMWLLAYQADLPSDADFKADLEDIWNQMKPLYEKIHAYVRYRYRQFWVDNPMGELDPIPAHLSGNMWAQTWQNTYGIVAPFPEVPNPLDQVDDALAEQGYTVPDIFDLSNSFYTILGLDDMGMCYDTPCSTVNTPANINCVAQNPMIEKPDWDVVCHASAWDMYHVGRDDYRIKMCTEVNLEDLVTVHHEMGHIEYFIQYEDQPLQFRDGANPGFHEAIGDTMALAVQTPEHLFSIGLLSEIPDSFEANINYLMNQAMERVMFLPFAYTIDQFRWALFNTTISQEQMNYKWWELRERYQGINPPAMRSEMDFDAGAKYHVAANVPYIRYFVAHILEYSFYKQMCLDAQQYDPADPALPLFRCDFSAGPLSPVAGARIKQVLKAGASIPWPEALHLMTGSDKMDASAILEYFQPLSEWLDEEIAAQNIPVGWVSTFENWMSPTA